MFSKPFGDASGYVVVGDSIETEAGPFRVVARIVQDVYYGLDDDDMHQQDRNHDCYSDGERGDAEHARAMEAREAYERGEWFYCGIILAVYVGDVELTDNAASLWGIEANYPQDPHPQDAANAYLLELADDLLPEAIDYARGQLETVLEAAKAAGIV